VVARAALALALVALGALTPVSRHARGETAGPGTVQAVLDARVAALASGDRDAWLATVDPNAPSAFRDAQGNLFDGLRSLPLESYSLVARTEDTGDLAKGAGTDAKYGAPTQLPETRQRMRIRGFDDRDAIDSLFLTYVDRGGQWKVAGDGDVADLGLDTARGLWDAGPVETLAGPHLLTIFHPAQVDRAKALAAIAEDAVTALRQRWDHPWSERIPLILPADTGELERLLQSTVDLDKFLAFVSYGAVRDEGWAATAPRIYIQDQNLSGYGRAFQVETLTHELSHAAGAPLAGPFLPTWVHEGVADWVATGRPTKEKKPAGSDGVLPRDHEFSTGSQVAIVRAYRESRSAISYLSARAGLTGPTAVFEEVGAAKVEPGSVDFHVDAALRHVAGLGLDDLQRGWARR
jgi:hypothetical protein